MVVPPTSAGLSANVSSIRSLDGLPETDSDWQLKREPRDDQRHAALRELVAPAAREGAGLLRPALRAGVGARTECWIPNTCAAS